MRIGPLTLCFLYVYVLKQVSAYDKTPKQQPAGYRFFFFFLNVLTMKIHTFFKNYYLIFVYAWMDILC